MGKKGRIKAVCKLCLEERPLIRSHLIPGGVYDLSNNEKGEHILVSSEVVMYSSRETKHYLLCYECDNSLNHNGESWVLPKLARDGTFPLLDILEKLPPDAVLPDGMTAYKAAENQELDIGKIVHFALGIFWKASVHSWKRQKRMDDPMIN